MQAGGRGRATLIGFGAVLIWALLALLTVRTAPVPPFQLTAMGFAIGGLAGLAVIALQRGWGRLARAGWRGVAFVAAGLWTYHALYFAALRLAPPAEAGLIAYLWPLLIVLFSGLLPGERLRAGHLLGATAAFAGAALVAAGGAAGGLAGGGPGAGHALALACAFVWAGWSVLSRRRGDVPTEAVAPACLVTAALSLPLHLAFETTAWPSGAGGWAALALLGAGPVGFAFWLWDIGVKRGDLQLLGVAAYAAPVLSTLALIGAGLAQPTPALAVGAALIAGGAALAARSAARL